MEDHDSAIIQDSTGSHRDSKQQDVQMQMAFLQRQDPFVSRILFASTFTAIYELGPAGDGEMRKLDTEGSLYLLERSSQPLFKMYVVNRKPSNDFTDWIDESTEFADRDNFVAYTARLPNNETRRRTFYFAVPEEKHKFLLEARKCIERVKGSSEKHQVREALIKVVQDDKFLDYFIKLLKTRQTATGQ